MGWFEYIYEIDWQEEMYSWVDEINASDLNVYPIETELKKEAWYRWLDHWRKKVVEDKKNIFTKRNQQALYFVDGRKKIYSRVLMKGGGVGVFVEILVGTVEWSLQRGIQVLFNTMNLPVGHRYFIVEKSVRDNIREPLPDKIILLPGEMEFDVVYVDSEDHINKVITKLMVDMEKEEIKRIASQIDGDNFSIIWSGQLIGLEKEFVYDNIPLVGFNRYTAIRYVPREMERIYDVLYDLNVSERTPQFAITGFSKNVDLVASYIKLINYESEHSTMRGVALFEVLVEKVKVPIDELSKLYDFLALMLPRLSTTAPFGNGVETLFPLLAVEGNLVHYFIPKEYVAYLITKAVVSGRQSKD